MFIEALLSDKRVLRRLGRHEVGRKESGAVSWTHEREAKLHFLFLRSFLKVFFLKFSLWQLWVFLPSAVRRSSEFFGMFSFFRFCTVFFWPCTSEKLCFKISGFCQTIFIRVTKSNLFLGRNCNDKKTSKMWVWCKPGERAFAVRYRMKIL